QDPARARLRALRELDLDRHDLVAGDVLPELLEAEAAVGLAAAEVARADLPDEVAAVPVVRRDPALARALPAAGDLGAAVERLDRRRGERAVAHARNVDDRARPEGARALAMRAKHLRAGHAVLRVVARLAHVRVAQREG